MYAANYVIVIQYKREGYQIPVLVLFSDSLTERKGKTGVPGKDGL